jgi:hypothetical protein
MKQLVLTFALALLAAALPTRLTAQTARDSVIAVVNEFFRAMTARDTAAFGRTLRPDGLAFAVARRGDSLAVIRQANDAMVRQFGALKDTYVERMWEPTVHVHGPIAVLWTPYDIHRNGQFMHCGVDAFTLIRDATGWKIATITYTAEPTGCAPSPLGPLRRPS